MNKVKRIKIFTKIGNVSPDRVSRLERVYPGTFNLSGDNQRAKSARANRNDDTRWKPCKNVARESYKRLHWSAHAAYRHRVYREIALSLAATRFIIPLLTSPRKPAMDGSPLFASLQFPKFEDARRGRARRKEKKKKREIEANRSHNPR